MLLDRRCTTTSELSSVGGTNRCDQEDQWQGSKNANFSTGLTTTLNMHQYPLPVPRDLCTQLDYSDYYLQVEVESSKKILIIKTQRGLR